MTHKLNHIAIIMDGNGRWAAKRNLPTAHGHKEGAEAARKILISCLKLGIPYLTLYTFSSENWNRNPEEVNELMQLLKFYLKNELDLLNRHQVKVKVIGDRKRLDSDTINLIDHCEETTKNNSKITLQIALSYGGREEIIAAQKKLFSDVISAKIKIENIDEKLFEQYLYTAGTPEPDLLIRTSGEHRLSNFLLWQSAYTEFYFTKVLWPDFNSSHLRKAIAHYNKRERRYGL